MTTKSAPTSLVSKPLIRRSLITLLSILCCWSACGQADDSKSDNTTPAIDDELRALLKKTIAQSDSFEDRFDAEVWLASKMNHMEHFVKDPEERFTILRKVHSAATEAGLQPEVVLAVIEVESRFDSYAVSRAGALGIMQVMPFWKDEIGRPEDNLINIDVNLRYGCTILKYYLDKAGGRIADALARYNGSTGEYWYPQRVMLAWEKNWR